MAVIRIAALGRMGNSDELHRQERSRALVQYTGIVQPVFRTCNKTGNHSDTSSYRNLELPFRTLRKLDPSQSTIHILDTDDIPTYPDLCYPLQLDERAAL